MISRRVADNPLVAIKDDLLFALRRIQLDLDAYHEHPADPAPLETLIEAIDQIRAPMAILEHHQAVALLDSMRETTVELARGALQSMDTMVLRQAADQLTGYLEACLSPGDRRPDAELSKVADTLRRARRQGSLADSGNGLATGGGSSVDPPMEPQAMADVLKRLQRIVANQLEPAADQPSSWEALRDDLHVLHRLLDAHGWPRPALVVVRLDRIVDTLAGGAAEYYGSLAGGVCAEILAQLNYGLEPFDGGGTLWSSVLRRAEDHLTELDTLLGLPTLTEAAALTPIPPAAPVINPDLPEQSDGSAPDLQADWAPVINPDLPEQSDGSAPDLQADWMTSNLSVDAIDWPMPAGDEPIASPTVRLESPSAAPVSEPTLALAPSAEDEEFSLGKDAKTSMSWLIPLIGLADADPEFTEVFIEEARGELATIREYLALWRQNPDNRQALTTLRRAFHTLKGSGRMVGATVIGDFAWEFENLLNQVLEGRLDARPEIADAVAAAVAGLAPLVGETPLQGDELAALSALAAQAQALLKTEPEPAKSLPLTLAIAPGIDPEFVEVFLEEARGELAAIQTQQAIWREHPADRQAIGIIRRAFHTLKGSGRVVGATVISDFAWCFENLLSQALNGALAVSPRLVSLVGEAGLALEPLIGEAPVTTETLAALTRLTASADELLQEAAANVASDSVKPVETVALAQSVESVESVQPLEPVKPVERVEPVGLIEPVIPIEVATPLEEIAATELAVDPEMAQVFQYEAAEILDASDAILQQLRTGVQAEPTALLNDLRRGMHTLKGSSRMTGIMTVGDLAHAAESVLDALGKTASQATAVVLDTLQNTLDRLNRMLAEATGGILPPAATDLISELHRLADAIIKGEPSAESPSVAPTGEPTALILEPHSFRAMTELDQELAQVFQTEASEILDSSDVILQRLREEPDNTERLNDLRREMHTLKGSSRMAGFMTVGDLAHAAESVLDALGKGTLKASPLILDPVQRALDRLHQLLAAVHDGVQPPAQQELIDDLHGVLGETPAARGQHPSAPVAAAAVSQPAPVAAPAAHPAEKPAAAAPADTIRVSAGLLNTLVNQMGESSIFRARIGQGVSAMSENLNDMEQTIARLRRHVNHLATQAEARIQSRQDQGPKAHQMEFDPLELDRFTELQQLSRSLMEIAEDLGSVGNALGEHTRDITTLLDQQGKVNKEIQQGLMRTGMVRFGAIIPRLRRVVRQAAQDLGKRAELLVGGEEAEVDRTVLENMVAPLEHMLRNSLAHGIELPEQRRAAGKPDIGTITLSLRREGAELVLELGDDGAGLNFNAIRVKGEEKGLLLPGQPATQEELIALLLRPGFSTASAVTQVSGRGVGMDVVNEAIRAMRGALLIQTEPGQGTRFIVRLPFSLAVTQALLVQAGDGVFAIPLLSIELVTRINEAEFRSYLSGEQIQHQYSGRHYPMHNLGILVGSEQMLPFDEVKDRRPPILLFRSAEASAALQVEAVRGNQEIIVKPVGPQFNGVPGISGATVLGDGRVVVVLELAALVRNIGSQRQKQSESRALRAARQEARQEKLNIMVIDDSITMRKVTSRVLERHNIQVTTAKDGLDAVAMLQTQVPDLAILDIEMPRMDGFEVVAHVRNQPHLRHLPIIMVTSRGGDKHRDRAMKLGVNDYLTKPYQEEQLMLSIRKILGERALELIT